MAFTEFYCKPTGSNLNGGGIASGAEPTDAAAYTSVNGNWNGSNIFTPTDSSTPASSVAVGDFASVYVDGSTVTGYVARVTAVAAGVNGAITLSTTAKSGTAPSSSATARSIKVGGAWKGPNAAEAFPFNFIASTQTNAAGDFPRVNFKNSGTYNVTAAMTHGNAGPIRFQGYTTTPGDLGKATIDGGATGTAYTLLTLSSGTNCDLVDLVLQNNGNSGAGTNLLSLNGAECMVARCVFIGAWANGINANSVGDIVIECEAYNCNRVNGAGWGGFVASQNNLFVRCVSHDNVAGTNDSGFNVSTSSTPVFFGCIADTNSARGFDIPSTTSAVLIGCDAYNNGSDGIRLSNGSAAMFYFENCGLVKNAGYGINGSTAQPRNGSIVNCAFGSGNQQNSLGQTNGLAPNAYTEFYCNPTTGSNLNGGGIASGAEPSGTAAYTSTNGNFDGTSIFTPTDGSTPSSTVSVGDFASVYNDGATLAVYVARVTAVAAGVNGAITLSTTAKAGAAPTSSATARSIKVGGAWQGPNAAIGFPFNFITATLTDAASDPPRVNFKNSATYAITAAITHNVAGPVRFQGYTSVPGDKGKAIFDGGTTGASYIVLSTGSSATNCDFWDFIFDHNGATGTVALVSTSTSEMVWGRCVFRNSVATGFVASGSQIVVIECEAYACNVNSLNVSGGFSGTGNPVFIRCIAHDNSPVSNPTLNGNGFYVGSTGGCPTFIDCIADSNSGIGFNIQTAAGTNLIKCDAYNNGSDGVRLANATASIFFLENCNFVKNGGWGINGSTAQPRNGAIVNCAFGSGSMVNGLGQVTGASAMDIFGTITYPANQTPWVDPANGDFRIGLNEAKGTGRGNFTQVQPGYAGTIAYPDIGAGDSRTVLSGSGGDYASIG